MPFNHFDSLCSLQAQLASPRGLCPPPGLRPGRVSGLALAQAPPWSPMQAHGRSGNIVPHAMSDGAISPRNGAISPRDILTHIDNTVSEMERELTDECTNFKHLLTALPEKDEQLEERIAELQKEVARAETFHREQNRQSKIQSQKMTELEEHIAEMTKKDAKYRDRISELEKDIGICQAENDKFKNEKAIHHNKVVELEQLLFASQEVEHGYLRQISELNVCCTSQKKQIDALGDDISNLRHANASQKKEQEGDRAKIDHLEHLLREAETCMQKQSQVHATQVSKIAELESVVQECRSLEEKHKNQILGLEKHLADARIAEQSHASRQQSHRSTIAELESRLANHEIAEETHRRQQSTHSQAVNSLEAQLLEARTHADNHGKSSQSLRVRISELECQLHEAQLATEKQSMQSGNYHKRVTELQKELTEAMENVDANRRNEASLKRQIVDLEAELSAKHSAITNMHSLERQLAALCSELSKETQASGQLRTEMETLRAASEQVAQHAESTLKSEAELKADLELRLQDALTENRELQDQCQSFRDRSDVQAELELKAADLLQKNRTLELQLLERESCYSISPRGSGSTRGAPRLAAALTSPRFASRSLRELDSFMPYTNNALAARAKQMIKNVDEVLQRSITLQVRNVASQVVLADRHAGLGYQAKLRHLTQRDELHADLRGLDLRLEDHIHSLSDLLSEVEASREYPIQERQEVAKMLRAELHMCNDEQQLLREARIGTVALPLSGTSLSANGPSSEMPEELMESLIAMRRRDFSGGQHSSGSLRAAAEYGRRDIIEYILLSNPEFPSLLSAKDCLGRTPVDIARVCGWPALERWLQDVALRYSHSQSHRRSLPSALAEGSSLEAGSPAIESESCAHGKSPASSASTALSIEGERRARQIVSSESSTQSTWKSAEEQCAIVPKFNIPPAHQELLDQIDKTGWNSMNWKNNYTLLHWGAAQGQGALCRYLVQLDANIGLRDSSGRLPAEMARQAGYDEVARFLEEMLMKPLTSY